MDLEEKETNDRAFLLNIFYVGVCTIFDHGFSSDSARQIFFLLLTGLAAAGGQFGVTAAYTYAPAREISVYDYTQIMFSAIMGLLVFGQLPDMLSFVGYCVIIAAGVIMFLYNKRRGGN